MNHPNIYFDSDDVERGYYVYAHKCNKTGVVFYIGKGKEERAWNDRRSRAWQEHVAKLEHGYDVLLLHQDLTEEEAINLERIEIQSHGGAAAQGGRLVNWIPGEAGDGFGVAMKIEVDWGDGPDEDSDSQTEDPLAVFRKARKYRSLTKTDKDNLPATYDELVGPAIRPIELLRDSYFDAGRDSELPYVIDSFRSHCNEICVLSRRIKRRKLSYHDFCDAVDSEIDRLELLIRRAVREHADPHHISLCQDAYDAVGRWCALFAEGTREEAQKASDEVHIARRFPPGQENDEDFAKYLALLRVFFGDQRAENACALRQQMVRDQQAR